MLKTSFTPSHVIASSFLAGINFKISPFRARYKTFSLSSNLMTSLSNLSLFEADFSFAASTNLASLYSPFSLKTSLKLANFSLTPKSSPTRSLVIFTILLSIHSCGEMAKESISSSLLSPKSVVLVEILLITALVQELAGAILLSV